MMQSDMHLSIRVVISVGGNSVPMEALPTLRYNLARCHEARGDLHLAKEGYEEVLKEHPDYVDCHLRLGYMKLSAGHKREAEDIFKKCIELPNGSEDARTVLCMLKQRQRDWKSAKVPLLQLCMKNCFSNSDETVCPDDNVRHSQGLAVAAL
jgi:tetratricopeptide (TPR) repeat protein